jgi:hypothetical protein
MFMRTARLAPLLVICLGLFAACASAPADTYRVHLDPAARAEPATGRMILFLIIATERPWPFTNPIDGPFFEKPQPIASIAVKDFKGGDVATLDGSSLAWPESLDKLEGKVRVQAILDADDTERSHTEGPGNVYSDVVEVNVSALRDDTIDLTLKNVVSPPPPPRREFTNLKWVTLRSDLLSAFYGRDVFHRAGVALPKGYHIPQYPRRQWPTFYVIPGFGGRDDGALDYAQMLMTEGVEEIAPIVVYVVLDPECALGHHGFCDSANNGPRGEALVKELIPHLEAQFRLIARPEARIVTGHSSGGWSSLWLQLNYPDVFGACWSSAPDPVDFSAFQMTDLYRDGNMFTMPEGGETPAYRALLSEQELEAGVSDVPMTVRQEAGMERAIDPDGRSGQQWDAWEAMFSPRDDKTMLPRPMFDAATGKIHQDVVEHWQRYDMAKLLEREWNRLGPVMLERVRLTVGDEDSFYLERAVMKLRDKVEALRTQHTTPAGDGYIRIVPRENHNTLEPKQFMRWNEERRAYLKKHGLFDDSLPPVRAPAVREP